MRTVVLLALPMLWASSLCAAGDGDSRREQASEQAWEQLRSGVFGDREINDAGTVVSIKAPFRAEDASTVPISVHALIPQQEDRYVQTLHMYVDKNPVPLVGLFDFTPASGKADLAIRIRVDDFTFVRAVAELNTGELYMAKTFVRSMGGCSAPPGASMQDSIKHLGDTRMRLLGEFRPGEPNLLQMRIRHPNITGMALDPRTNAMPPAYFVNAFEVSYAGRPLFKARTTFSISQDPSYRFFFVPENAEGSLQVRAMDTKQHEFVSEHPLAQLLPAGYSKG